MKNLSINLIALAATCAIALSANGADRYWLGDAPSNNWSEPDNWSPAGPPQNGDTLIFGNIGVKRSNNNNLANLQVQSIVFAGTSGGYSLGGNPILLISDVTSGHSSGLNAVRFGIQFTTGGGTFGVANRGRLEIGGTVTLANNALLGTYTIGTNLTISGAVTGAGELMKLGEQSLFLTGSSANTYTGPTTIRAGAVYLAKSSGAQAVSSRVSIGEDTEFNCMLADMSGGQYPASMSIYVGPYATWGLTNGATVTSLTIDSGSIRGDGLLNLQGNVTNYGYSQVYCSLYLGNETRTFGTYSDGGYSQLELHGHVLGPSGGATPPGIIKEGSGILILRDQNTYSGVTLINNGALFAEHGDALGTATGETRVRPFAVLSLGRTFATTTITIPESVVMEGGRLSCSSDVVLNGSLALNADSDISGPFEQGRLDINNVVTGPGRMNIRGGTVRLSGTTANTFAGEVLIEPNYFAPQAVLELNKLNGLPAVPTPVTLRRNGTNAAVLRNFQHNGVRDVSIYDGGLWHLNGHGAAPDLLKFYGGGVVDTGPGVLDFAGLTVNTQLQVFPKLTSPSNYTARILGHVFSFSPTNDLFIPPGVTLDISAEIVGSALQKRGPGKLVLGGDNRVLARIFAMDGELVSTHSRALGGQTRVFDGATLWLESVFNFGSLTIQGRGFQDNGALGTHGVAIFSSNLVLAAATTINTVTTNANFHIQAPITGTGPLTKEGVGFLTFEGNTPNTFAGAMFVNAGMFVPAKPDFVPAVPGDLVIGSGVAGVPGAVVLYGGHDQVWNRITVNRDSLLNLNGRDEYSGDITLNNGGDIVTGAGTLYLGEGVNVFANMGPPSEWSEISGRIALGSGPHRFHVTRTPPLAAWDLLVSAKVAQMSSAAAILKDGTGSLVLISSNSFAGALTINEGLVHAAHGYAFGTSAGETVVNDNASLVIDGNIRVREEPLTLNSTNWVAFGSVGGSNVWGGNIMLQRTANIYVPFDTLNIFGQFDCCPGIISGPGGIIKNGEGALLITGFAPNDYDGPTIVNEGALEAWRILAPALPGDVIVRGSNSVLRTGRSPANTALASGASVIMEQGGRWTLNPTNIENVRAACGDGALYISTGASLTLNNTNFCEFTGYVGGPGAIDKRGQGMFRLTGESPFYGGPLTIYEGTVKVDGRIAGSPVTVKAGAQLRGDGAVGNVIATEQDSLVQVDASSLDHPGRQGGDLDVSYLTLGSGAGVVASIYGPSPIGGNDTVIAHGPVSLGNARLSTEFNYAPHEGDVITLLRKNSVGPIDGIFSGWTEGITRKLGGVTVRATYLGGDGNDFTLTVTNVPVRSFGYRLAEGNGNQTVEPDECNLIFPLVGNWTTNSLTITNASLRSLTPGAVVTVPSAIYPAIPRGFALENITPFQFRTDPSFPCGRPVTLELVLGIENEGVFAVIYEIVAGEGEDCTHPTGGCESCFVVSGQFTTNTPALARPLNFIGGPSTCFPLKRCPEMTNGNLKTPVPYITHMFTNSSTNEVCVTAQLRFGCAGAPTNVLGAIAYLGTNDYHDPCVNYLGDTGVDGTQPFSFRVPAATNFIVLVSARATNAVCDTYSMELFGLPCPPPSLRIAKGASASEVLLQWSSAYPDYRLQATNACHSPGPFGDVTIPPVLVDGLYTVTNSAPGPRTFYRLAK
jgi:autotransporter-associated beta strand protein